VTVSRTVEIVIAIVVIVLLVALVLGAVRRARRRAVLRRQFGPEYDHVVDARGRRKGSRELEERTERRSQLDIRPLAPAAVERYRSEWRLVQERFVDAPAESVGMAHRLLTSAMSDRGYPTGERSEQMSMLSVDHADVMTEYRRGNDVEQEWRARGTTDTEDLRQAMVHYRSVFDRVVGETATA
jgi:hypothetical protein